MKRKVSKIKKQYDIFREIIGTFVNPLFKELPQELAFEIIDFLPDKEFIKLCLCIDDLRKYVATARRKSYVAIVVRDRFRKAVFNLFVNVDKTWWNMDKLHTMTLKPHCTHWFYPSWNRVSSAKKLTYSVKNTNAKFSTDIVLCEVCKQVGQFSCNVPTVTINNYIGTTGIHRNYVRLEYHSYEIPLRYIRPTNYYGLIMRLIWYYAANAKMREVNATAYVLHNFGEDFSLMQRAIESARGDMRDWRVVSSPEKYFKSRLKKKTKI